MAPSSRISQHKWRCLIKKTVYWILFINHLLFYSSFFSPSVFWFVICFQKARILQLGKHKIKVKTWFSPSCIFYFAVFIFSCSVIFSPSPLRNFAWKQTWNFTAFIPFSPTVLILIIHNFEFFVVIELLLSSSLNHLAGWEIGCNTDIE